MSNMQLMQDLYAALGRGDMPSVRGAMDPAIGWREAEGNPYQPSDAGPVIVVEARYTGTFKQAGKELDAKHPGMPHLEDPRRPGHQLPAVRGHSPAAGRGGHPLSG